MQHYELKSSSLHLKARHKLLLVVETLNFYISQNLFAKLISQRKILIAKVVGVLVCMVFIIIWIQVDTARAVMQCYL